jgi:hypothetical protein
VGAHPPQPSEGVPSGHSARRERQGAAGAEGHASTPWAGKLAAAGRPPTTPPGQKVDRVASPAVRPRPFHVSLRSPAALEACPRAPPGGATGALTPASARSPGGKGQASGPPPVVQTPCQEHSSIGERVRPAAPWSARWGLAAAQRLRRAGGGPVLRGCSLPHDGGASFPAGKIISVPGGYLAGWCFGL